MASLLNMSGGSLLGKGLPYDAEIEYLEGTGIQWIDTDFKAIGGNIQHYKVKFHEANMMIVYSIDRSIGNDDFDRNGFSFTFKTHNRKTYADFNKRKYYSEKVPQYTYIYTPDYNQYYEIYYNNIGDNYIGKVNNDYIFNTTIPDSTLRGTNTVKIFKNDYSITIKKGVICWLKLYNSNNILVRDFIPVRVGNVGYMYDKVSKQLFGNSGTGDFILGPDK